MSTIRFATMADIPALITLARQMHVQSRYAWMPFDSDHLWRNLEQIISSKWHCLVVANDGRLEAQGGLRGVLLATAQVYPFCNNVMVRIDCLYVLPAHRGSPVAMKMLAGFRRWADNRQVVEIVISNDFGTGQRVSKRLLKKLKLNDVGSFHSMWMERS